MKAQLDKMLDKRISRKLQVMILSSVWLWFGLITGTQWVNVAIMYIGTQGAIDAIEALRGGKK